MRKYDKLKKDPNQKKILQEMRKAVKNGEKTALEMLVNVFDWLDGLQPQPTTEILDLGPFYFAEDYHQQYLAKNPGGYCGLGGTGVTCAIGTGVAAAE